MPLKICPDLSAADWIVTSKAAWEQVAGFGPAGFEAYARVRFIPDPTHPFQQETDADLSASPDEVAQWRALLWTLDAETADPADCFFALWNGWGLPESTRRWPTFGIPQGARPPARSYFLFHGALSDGEIWGDPADAGIWGATEFSRGGTPAFVWPSDHTWCVAADIDPHWAGVGAATATIERLLTDRRLDAVAANPGEDQPAYR